jgi:hypothetical protein
LTRANIQTAFDFAIQPGQSIGEQRIDQAADAHWQAGELIAIAAPVAAKSASCSGSEDDIGRWAFLAIVVQLPLDAVEFRLNIFCGGKID